MYYGRTTDVDYPKRGDLSDMKETRLGREQKQQGLRSGINHPKQRQGHRPTKGYGCDTIQNWDNQ